MTQPNALGVSAVAMPPSLEQAEDYPDFLDCLALRRAHELETWGNLDRGYTAAEELEHWRGTPYEARHLFLGRISGEPVGMCSVTLPLRENLWTAGINVLVARQFRHRGLGRQLLHFAEAVAQENHRTSLDGYFELPAEQVDRAAGALLPAKSGAGGLPADEPSTAFAAAAGYGLEQVEKSSRLSLPVPPQRLAALEASARGHAGDYDLVGWADACPEELVDSYAILNARMSTDVPTAGLDWEGEAWDADRVRRNEEMLARSGMQALTAAAKHRPTGELVAYTVLNWRAEVPATVLQQDTLVSSGHRGHRLGMLVKLMNLRMAQERWPSARSVLTWNATENQHMLAINIALGFRPAGYEGEWQKRLG
ncbi:acetyltransferase (GNAT) family protein [Pseudarthrobacter phenanthrenivorans Sphe3]|uniref:Acetyltransferase (GNAT) family protein n=1 Tax=Pseudarthrobacter phenanthrenivorans (strain DSM 18606 / JCM 16027 / LMG 23796 / Sphe3) TaxID=930171 RepID=F0MAL9_PSEPM|nr:GNAT family N-acetyltransferase [Pseudarthrobacter phenanthrenivorans]ADX73952.1 acetyltransferase (GNAT) family protein [Pseudarthrobacter phenanthrenivorans Sphe3]